MPVQKAWDYVIELKEGFMLLENYSEAITLKLMDSPRS